MQRLPQLSNLAFPRLRSISKQLRLEQLPSLTTLGFDAVITELPFFSVTNTTLQSIFGIDPIGTTNGFSVTDNMDLRDINMTVYSTRLTIDGTVTVAENSPELGVSFPHLVSSQNLEFSNLSSISLPLLTESNEIALRSTTLETFSAPNLANVGNGSWGLWFEACHDLVDIEVPSLVATGGFIVLDSELVQNLTLPKLQTNGFGFRLVGKLAVSVLWLLPIPLIANLTIGYPSQLFETYLGILS